MLDGVGVWAVVGSVSQWKQTIPTSTMIVVNNFSFQVGTLMCDLLIKLTSEIDNSEIDNSEIDNSERTGLAIARPAPRSEWHGSATEEINRLRA